VTPLTSPQRNLEGVPALKSLHPDAAQWIGTLIRMTSPHPAMTRILDVIERLSERPYRTNFVLLGEPGTGKEGLGRALAHLACPGGPLVRFDVAGFPEEEALDLLCGSGRRRGIAEAADGGTILLEELAGLGPRVQAALLRLLKSGQCERRGVPRVDSEGLGGPVEARAAKRLRVHVVATSDRDLALEVGAGRLRHDLYYRLARVVLWLPPLRERVEDIRSAVVWMGNRILRAASPSPLELVGDEDFRRAAPDDRARMIALSSEAVRALEGHPWAGNFRELEAVLERALLLYRRGDRLDADDVMRALAAGHPPVVAAASPS
jgi:DNA-binding NtrC family response regulator